MKGFHLERINLEIHKGEYYVLLGPSGAGKTILLETLAGIHRQKSGKIYLNGKDVSTLPPESRGIGFVPQDLALFPHLSVLDNILFGVRVQGIPGKDYQALLDRLISKLQISERLMTMPRILSGGEKQRVALARALLTRPKILLLDEPLSSLDPPIRRELLELLKEIHRDFHVTTLHVTHDQEEAFILGDVISVLLDGKIEQTGKKNRVYFFPRTCRIAVFTGMENIFHGNVVHVDPAKKEVHILHKGLVFKAFYDKKIPQKQVYFGVRGEEVMIVKEHRPLLEKIKEENLFSVVLTRVIEKGWTHTLVFEELSNKIPFVAEVPNYVFRKLQYEAGQQKRIFIRRRNICFMEE
ncbi:MAG: ATP-binding cassette domain-containing protein [Deltaproteobacteria bacterium]|nr:ATP-binding cassette domain-containing protein [Deltaproteobacteria bacterium]MBW2306266.1 ATP-binding cassette domain-containing protein [Deltaproteobacteria bacterium]